MNNPRTDIGLQAYKTHIQDMDEDFVSDSPYLRSFAVWNSIHEQLQKAELTRSMLSAGYSLSKHTVYPLPDGKALLGLDYLRLQPIEKYAAFI